MSDSTGSEVFKRNDPTEVDQLRAEVTDLKAAISSLQAKIADMRAITDGLSDLQGDENVSLGNGFIEFDRTVSKHPVIRFRADRLPQGGGGVEVKGVDTDGNETSAVATKSITFTTGDDSKVGFVVDDDVDGNVTVAVDVYWK